MFWTDCERCGMRWKSDYATTTANCWAYDDLNGDGAKVRSTNWPTQWSRRYRSVVRPRERV